MAAEPTFVVVGAGLAGAKAAETLRDGGFDGRVVLVGAEDERPYERPPLSKDYLRGETERAAVRVHGDGCRAARASGTGQRPGRDLLVAHGRGLRRAPRAARPWRQARRGGCGRGQYDRTPYFFSDQFDACRSSNWPRLRPSRSLDRASAYRTGQETCDLRFLLRRHATAPPEAVVEDPRAGISGVRFVDDDKEPHAEDAAARAALRRIIDETILLQGLTEDILVGIRERRSLGELARPGGALVSRFVALRAAVPEPADRHLRDVAGTLRETLDHHALVLSSTLDLLADLRPERVSELLDRIDGLGAPARPLCALQSELGAC